MRSDAYLACFFLFRNFILQTWWSFLIWKVVDFLCLTRIFSETRELDNLLAFFYKSIKSITTEGIMHTGDASELGRL